MNARATTILHHLCPLVLGLGLLAGCATKKPAAQSTHFFPPPPDAPRLQFLTGFSSERDFRGGEERTLMSFVTGAQPLAKEIAKPYGAVASGHRILICDTGAGAVLMADVQSRRFGVLETHGEGALKQPLNITADAEGTIYVADTGREQVVIFDKAGNYLATLGQRGEMKPRDVAVDQNRIYIADLQTHNVHVFDKASRKPLFDIPHAGDRTNRTRGLFTPTNLALDAKGRVYVSDSGAFRVQVYDAEGNYLRSVGEMGDGQGQFARVKGIAVDRENRLYAADAMSQVVQVFDEQGRLLTWFADPSGDGRLQNLPAKVLLDYEDVSYFQKYAAPNFQVEHLVIVINQIGPHKVGVYGFGHKK